MRIGRVFFRFVAVLLFLVMSFGSFAESSYAGTYKTCAQDHRIVINSIYTKLPTITKFERFCVLNYAPGEGLKDCLGAQPKTELYQLSNANIKKNFELLNAIAAGLRNDETDDLPFDDPWITYCVINEKPECVDDCINGFVCP